MIHRLHNDKSIRLCLYSFRADTKSYPVSGRYHEYEQQRYRTGASRSHIGIQHPAGKVGREGLVKWIPVLTAEYLLPSTVFSGFQSLLLLMHFRYCPNTCSSYTQAWQRTSERSHMWRTTFVIGTSQLLSETEIAPKSPFLCVNRSPSVPYGFPAGARAIRDSMNIAFSLTREKCYHIWNGYLYFLNWFSITNQEQDSRWQIVCTESIRKLDKFFLHWSVLV